jgi:hypothetical protein
MTEIQKQQLAIGRPTQVPNNWLTYPSKYPSTYQSTQELADLPKYPSIGRPTRVPKKIGRPTRVPKYWQTYQRAQHFAGV